MKEHTAGLKEWLASNTQLYYAECFSIRLLSGDTFYYTTAQRNIKVIPVGSTEDVIFSAKGLLIKGLRYHASLGVTIDEQEVEVIPRAGETLQGIPFMQALRTGSLDGATIRRDRYFFQQWNDAPVGGAIFFEGKVSTATEIGNTVAKLKVKSHLVYLDINMPRDYYGAACRHTLFDDGCKLIKSAFSAVGTVGGSPTQTIIPWAGATAGYYSLGTVQVASGQNAGQTRSIRKSTGTSLILNYPWEFEILPGDTFTAFPGCDKLKTTCDGKYSNGINFVGFPFVPVPETAA